MATFSGHYKYLKYPPMPTDRHGQVKLAPTTTAATSAASPNSNGAMDHLHFYSEKGCTGDSYVVQGYNPYSVVSDLTSTSSSTGVSCGWYTNEGFS